MARILSRVGVVLLVLAALGGVYVYQTLTSLELEPVTDDVTLVTEGAGIAGNSAVLRTDRGAVVVDTKLLRVQGARLRELAERIGGGPTQVIINTHYHRDHTHGNPAFAPGSQVVATRATRDFLRAWDAEYFSGDAEQTLPNEVFDDEFEIRIGGKTVRCHYLGPAHTGGDLVVLFVEDRVLVTGDLFFNGRYPFIDVAAGGSARAWDEALERALALEFDRVIPGHGPVADRERLEEFQLFMRELWETARTAVEEGRSFEEALAAADLRYDDDFEVVTIPFVQTMDLAFSLRPAFDEARGAVRLRPPAGERS